MSEDIRTGMDVAVDGAVPRRRLVPMQVGEATVYVEQIGDPAVVESDDAVRPVSPLSPQHVFENAGDILRECVRVIGDRLAMIADAVRPDEVTVEFSLSFEVKGRASVIPVFITGETGTETGLKVTASWKRAQGHGAAP
jgi:Trypsin-co-occurring domain 1